MFDAFRPFFSRIIAAAVAALAGTLTAKTGITIDPATQGTISTAVTVGVYGVTHKVLDKWINPGDAASSHLATASVADAAAAKDSTTPITTAKY